MERSGAAQGLAEVVAVLGPEHLAGLLPDILHSCRGARHFEREGALTLFKFLPLAVPDDVQVGPCRLHHSSRRGGGRDTPQRCTGQINNCFGKKVTSTDAGYPVLSESK